MKFETRTTQQAASATSSSHPRQPPRPSLNRENASLESCTSPAPNYPHKTRARAGNIIIACPCRDATVSRTMNSSSSSSKNNDDQEDTNVVVTCSTAAGYMAAAAAATAAAATQEQVSEGSKQLVDDDNDEKGHDADDEWADESFDSDAVPIRLGSRLRAGSWRGDNFVRP
ncbi:hypothetical protein PFICI_11500 [Pestalotiopsis fici W106-1]|uniref:Uncharacterized protein n=1 Tax=Pestalotiopsis fici (strain W106-1 / CGMCC3.15140) TaxID=1229662 RepID=W3WQI9_PESFW|nr:uncharacterized protein PFICI_11500 [Pestalotiopsis fici W106-1]ETS76113.1 hypothetical protein PFICI_11500 [Pestalotiopsis fici W106-1]